MEIEIDDLFCYFNHYFHFDFSQSKNNNIDEFGENNIVIVLFIWNIIIHKQFNM